MMTKSDWKILLASLNQASCVALIGPNLSTTVDDDGKLKNLARELSCQLAGELKDIQSDKKVEIPDPHKLPLVAQCYSDCFSPEVLNDEVMGFYRKFKTRIEAAGADDAAFESLAALPLPLFISARHDCTLQYFLTKCGKTPIEKIYNFTGDQQRSVGDLGSVEKPLVYHLLGCMDDPRSLAVTEKDLLELLESIISGNPALPNDLRNAFKEKSFLFLGCGLHTYYSRVLLHALGLHESGKPSFAPASVHAREQTEEFRSSVWFYEVGYKTLRLLDMDEREFLLELRQQWDEKYPDGPPHAARSTPQPVDDEVELPQVFISYVSEDEEPAKRLVQALGARGIKPWLDKQELKSGDEWDRRLEKTIKQVDFFIVLLSEHLSDHVETFVHKEIRQALDRQSMKGGGVKFIFPVRIDATAPRLDALDRANIQTSDLKDFDADVADLASEIKKQFAKIQRR